MELIIASHNIDEFEWIYLTEFTKFSFSMERQMRKEICEMKTKTTNTIVEPLLRQNEIHAKCCSQY